MDMCPSVAHLLHTQMVLNCAQFTLEMNLHNQSKYPQRNVRSGAIDKSILTFLRKINREKRKTKFLKKRKRVRKTCFIMGYWGLVGQGTD